MQTSGYNLVIYARDRGNKLQPNHILFLIAILKTDLQGKVQRLDFSIWIDFSTLAIVIVPAANITAIDI